MAMSYRLGNHGIRVHLRAEARNFSLLHSVTYRLALGQTQLPIQWVPQALSLGAQRQRCKAGHLPPPSAKVNGGAIPPLPHVFMV
jgi:hypothetical protein